MAAVYADALKAPACLLDHEMSYVLAEYWSKNGKLEAARQILTSLTEAQNPRWAQRAGVFCFVTFAWIFFRAGSINDAGLIVLRLFTSGWGDPHFPILMAIPIALVWLWQLSQETDQPRRRLLDFAPARVAIAVFMIGYLIFVSQSDTQRFIYFSF